MLLLGAYAGWGLAVSDLLMLLFETYGGWSEPVVRLFRRMQDTVRNKLTKRQYENEVSCSELVDVDVARAAGTAPVGGGAHSFGVGDRDRDAACLLGVGARRPSSDEEGGRRHGVSPHRTLSGHVVCLFVFVCFCVCTLE